MVNLFGSFVMENRFIISYTSIMRYIRQKRLLEQMK
jgi:hypothetical protein